MECDQTREWRCGVCVGILTEGWPWGKLIASPDHIEIRSNLGNYSLAREDVTSIEPAGGFPWLWTGVRIHHTSHGCPELAFRLGFFRSCGPVLDCLKKWGYIVP